MSDSLSAKSIKDALAECPICAEYFHETTHIPRRMPCCSQTICEPCLERYSGTQTFISCPLCRHPHNISHGVKSFPKEMLILRFLDVLKTQENAVPSCTDCPENNTAMAKCDTCNVYLCQPCLALHLRNDPSRNHKTATFEKIKHLPQMKTEETKTKLKVKLEGVSQRLEVLTGIDDSVQKSKMAAAGQINSCFDDLIEMLQQRRAYLLSDVESKAFKEQQSIKKAVESHKTLQLKLYEGTTNKPSSSLEAFLNVSPVDVEYDRLGVSFTQANIPQLIATVKEAGQVRCVTYDPTEKPDGVPDAEIYKAIKLIPDHISNVADTDMRIPGNGEVICPHLEWDINTASRNVALSGYEVTNIQPNTPTPDTGYGIQAKRRVFASRPLVIGRGQRVMFHVKVGFSLKQVVPEKKMIFESSLTSSLVDTKRSQPKGLSVKIVACNIHKQMCFFVRYDGNTLSDIPLIENKVGESRDLHLCFLLDGGTNKIHIADASDGRVIQSVGDVAFDRPLWTMMYLAVPSWSDMTGEVIAGNRITVTNGISRLLSSLH